MASAAEEACPGRGRCPLGEAQICNPRPGELLAQRQHGLHAHEADDGIDLHMGPERRGARGHRHLQRPPGASADVVDGEAPLDLSGEADGLLQGARCRAHAAGEQGLVEMDVSLHQAGRDQPAGHLHDLSRRAALGRWRDAPTAMAMSARWRSEGGRRVAGGPKWRSYWREWLFQGAIPA
jgi:hypothetical protein